MIKISTITLTCALLSSVVYGQGVPPLTSTISGVVWQESKPVNGLRISSEKKVAGILVKLLDATQQDEVVVSSALSDVNGAFELKANAGTYKIEYVYPTDGFYATTTRVGSDKTVNSAANEDNFTDEFTVGDNETISDFGLGLVAQTNTLTYCTQEPATVTEWTKSLTLPKSDVGFNPTNVKIFAAEAVYHPKISVENTGTAGSYEIMTAGKVTMTIPGSSPAYVMNSDVTLSGSLDSYDGNEDYEGASGETFYNHASYQAGNPARNITSGTTIGNNYVGSGTFSITTKSQSAVTITSGGNLKTIVQTYVSAGACVVYTYPAGALPVKLASFNAKKEGETVNLRWVTSEEIGSERFEIERSQDGRTWTGIGSVLAAGTINAIAVYNFTDIAPAGGQNLYRLKMIDLDQTFAYSVIKEVSFKSKSALYPNPAVSAIYISDEGKGAVQKVSVYNAAGQLVKHVANTASVDISSLSNGVYSVKTIYSSGETRRDHVLIAH